MKRDAIAASVLALLILTGCQGSDDSSSSEVGIAGDERFRLDIRTRGTSQAGAVDVEITPRGEWHLALDAPARVRFESDGSCSPSPSEIEREEASEDTESKLSFQTRWEGSAQCDDVRGSLKFGLCYGSSTRCSIVRERFALVPCNSGLCPEGS